MEHIDDPGTRDALWEMLKTMCLNLNQKKTRMNKPLIIFAVGPWYPNSAFRYLTDAFERFGHRVMRFGPDYNNPYGIKWDTSCSVHINVEVRRESTWNLEYCVETFGVPDFIFTSEETYHNKIIPTNKAPIILYSIDGWPENFERIVDFQATLAYMEDPLGIRSHPRKIQDFRWRFMPGAAAPWVHKDLMLPRTDDFYFCGTMYVNRPILCQYLRERGLRVHATAAADTIDYTRGLSTAKTTLHDCNGEDRVKWRFFEGMACGCLVISDHTRLLDWLGYKPWEHYLPCNDTMCESGEPAPDMQEIANCIQWANEHPNEAQHIAENGKRFTLNFHTYEHRALTILSDFQQLSTLRVTI